MKKIILFILIIPLNVLAITYPNINSKYAIIYDKTDNKILYEKDGNQRTYIASLTKIATTITAIENIQDLGKEVIITRDILNTVSPIASIAGLKVGDKLTYKDLLYASMVPSGADATNSLAILSSGSIDSFVEKMNKLAKKLDLNDTHFVNVTGLDVDNHYSSASDICKLLSYALDDEIFREVFTTKKYTLSNNLKVSSTLYIYNKNLNKDISPIIGSKTGYTKKAGYSIATLSNTDGHDIIMILLGAPSEEQIAYHIIDDLNLIEFINNNYDNQVLIKNGDIIKEIPIALSKDDIYIIKTDKDVIKFLPNDYDRSLFKVIYNGKEELSFNDKIGTRIGGISYYYDNELINQEDVILDKDIKIDYIKVLKKYYYIIGLGLGLIFSIIFVSKILKK